jgi:hypothetical protein
MAYSRFTNSDIYIYPSIEGHVECAACILNEPQDEYSLFSMSEKIYDDGHLIVHIREHIKIGHDIPVGLLATILSDAERYSKIS